VLVYLNDRGMLNLINEVTLEDYLRGVVPREMGPRVYDQLEALKAQAVAARTYTLRNLGEFAEEGYDICATPRCQVYGGLDDEQPLTDRAIAETAGEVLLWNGEPIDALYSSTCGGHTEDVEAIFPLKRGPYLRGVACLESGLQSLAGDLPAGAPFPDALVGRLLPPPAAAGQDAAASLGARLQHLALLAGLPLPQDRLASLAPREVQRYLASLLDLALDARLLVAPEDLAYLLAAPPADWRPEERRLAAHLQRLGLLDPHRAAALAPSEAEELLLRLALYLGVLNEKRARFLAVGEGRLRVRAEGAEGEEQVLSIGTGLATFREQSGRAVAAPLALVAGDRVRLYSHGERLLAVVQEVHREGVAFDRTSNYSSWTRFRSDVELRELVRTRLPGFELRSFEILDRGRSGRVTRIRLLGADGQQAEVVGLPVRWTLNVPDTLFTAKRLAPAGRPAGWLFTGRGWGHGVGLCQVGAYGMAVRGHDYRAILAHYYSGVVLARLEKEADT
jgi:stage II sporulation protein D